jgi:hypothetical protein
MKFILFLPSFAYLAYNLYHAFKGTVPRWLGKRLYKLRNHVSYQDVDNKRWDTPIGALSKIYSLSVLFTSYIVLTFLTGWDNLRENGSLYFSVFTFALCCAFFAQKNFSRNLTHLRRSAGEEQ